MNVARIILGLPHDPDVYPGAAPGLDPNLEHPPLAKLIIALSMRLIGDNAYGYRLPSVAFGVASIFLFYLILKRLSRNSAIAFLGAFALSFDNLFFVHGRIATLDISMLAFMLMGFYLYLIGRPNMSAVAMALSSLCKLGGIYGALVVMAFHLSSAYLSARREGRGADPIPLLKWIERYALVFALSFLIGLGLLDWFWTKYKNPIEHLSFILTYTRALTRPVPTGIESYPWQWLLNEVKIPYLTVNVNILENGVVKETKPAVAFVGAMNPFIIYLCIPSMAYMIYKAIPSGDGYPLFMALWFSLTYLPFLPFSLIWHRIMYIFYFLLALPSVCGAISYAILDQRPPKIAVFIYMAAIIAGFYLLFPFKSIP